MPEAVSVCIKLKNYINIDQRECVTYSDMATVLHLTISVHPTVIHVHWLVLTTSKCWNKVRNRVRRPHSLVGVTVNSWWVMSRQDSEAPGTGTTRMSFFFVWYLSVWIQWHPYGTCTTSTTPHNAPLTTQACSGVQPHKQRAVSGHVIWPGATVISWDPPLQAR